jgi:hypothetical protein
MNTRQECNSMKYTALQVILYAIRMRMFRSTEFCSVSHKLYNNISSFFVIMTDLEPNIELLASCAGHIERDTIFAITRD